jgi:uncharacterized protein (TIGR03083 family)
MFPGANDFRAERRAVLATMESLTPEEFESGPTLCEGWAPRDVLGHLIGIDETPAEYVKAGGNVHKANARIVERMRTMSREQLLERARDWAARPATLSLVASWGLLGDLGVHHQDVLRALGRRRVEPTDTGRAVGRGQVVRGTAEQLGMWLAGRRSVEPELVFGAAN